MKSWAEIASCSFLSEEQLQTIEKYLLESGNFSEERIRQQIDAICCKVGLDAYYFQTTPLNEIARHIEAIRAAEIISQLDQKKEVKVDLKSERETSALYIVSEVHDVAIQIERHIEERYPLHRIHSYRTLGMLLDTHLRIYLVSKPIFDHPDVGADETDIHKLGSKQFLSITPPEAIERYQNLINSAGNLNFYIDFSEKVESQEIRAMMLTHSSNVKRLFSAFSDVMNYYGIYTNRKYFEPMAHGKTALSFYFNVVEDQNVLDNIREDISLLFALPETRLSPLFRSGKLSAREMCYGAAAANFAHQFLTSYSDEYLALLQVLEGKPELKGTLETLRYNLLKEAYSEERVFEAMIVNPEVLKSIYKHFETKFLPNLKHRNTDEMRRQAEQKINQDVEREMDQHILRFVLEFNDYVLKTNFYINQKSSLSFRLATTFIKMPEYPEQPFGVFYILGSEFRGFHVRFRDVARGGIRIVRSIDEENYLDNSDAIFDENYNLARTQQSKNKDIPEGGSKGALILNLDAQDKAEIAFEKYIDGLLDIILPDNPGIVDYYGKTEILFLGPDEGTAELMDWASTRARERGYRFWKAFSTGKSLERGGIPHDMYGMTTNSVHQYALKIMEKLGLDETQVTKFQTGGPDGDLGSNEILISKDTIIGIVDGSGVVFDPKGLNRDELTRLARKRVMIKEFNREKLSKDGYVVLTSDHNVKLPGGENVADGTLFRNTFHMRKEVRADFFIPCGGRPKSVHIGNWTELLDERGRVRFKYIIEGANLFITQDARLRLEEKGAIIYKDASANKGGVTSSSLEVFASLALTDEQYQELLCVHKGKSSPFREKYVQQVLDIIRKNAVDEFNVIWEAHEKKGIKRPILTDIVGKKINDMTDQIQASDLFDNEKLRKKVISNHCPQILLETVGFKQIMTNVPENYLQAIFASHLASRYIYKFGLDSNEINFLAFIHELEKE